MKIVIIDKSQIFQEGLKFFIENILFHEVMATYSDGEELLTSDEASKTDIVLYDIPSTHKEYLQIVRKFLWVHPNKPKLIALTNFEEDVYLSELISAGFKGCVFKSEIYEELEKAINTVSQNKIYFPQNIKIN